MAVDMSMRVLIVDDYKTMLNIIRKTDKLDERMRLARESRRY